VRRGRTAAGWRPEPLVSSRVRAAISGFVRLPEKKTRSATGAFDVAKASRGLPFTTVSADANGYAYACSMTAGSAKGQPPMLNSQLFRDPSAVRLSFSDPLILDHENGTVMGRPHGLGRRSGSTVPT
jgi:hypothetical protein